MNFTILLCRFSSIVCCLEFTCWGRCVLVSNYVTSSLDQVKCRVGREMYSEDKVNAPKWSLFKCTTQVFFLFLDQRISLGSFIFMSFKKNRLPLKVIMFSSYSYVSQCIYNDEIFYFFYRSFKKTTRVIFLKTYLRINFFYKP